MHFLHTVIVTKTTCIYQMKCHKKKLLTFMNYIVVVNMQ